jgi:hypothetical protein
MPDCDRPHRVRGLCNSHYIQARETRSVHTFPKVRPGKRTKCAVAGCDKEHASRGLCGMHYSRVKRRGNLDHYSWDDPVGAEPARKFPASCSEPDCEDKHFSLGLCNRHYQREQRRKRRALVCSMRGCTAPSSSKGLCHNHYQCKRDREDRARKKRLRLQGVSGKPCLVPDCEAVQYDHGLCRKHHKIVKDIDSLDLVESVFGQGVMNGEKCSAE